MKVVEKSVLPEEWTGLSEKRFAKYRTWINREKPGVCGTYASAVLIHDAILQNYHRSLNKETLLAGLKPIIEKNLPYKGTFFWDLKHGIELLLENVPDWQVKTGFVTDRIVPQLLNTSEPGPVIVGTSRFLNSPYKNHWLVVYAYGYNKEGKLFFKGYDNHGSYQAVVPASQTIACVWLDKNKKG